MAAPNSTTTSTFVGGGNAVEFGNPTAPVTLPLTAAGMQTAGLYAFTNAGSIVKYQIAPAVNSDAATTTTNQTTSITSQIQVGMTFATNSVYGINKVANQAGLGIA